MRKSVMTVALVGIGLCAAFLIRGIMQQESGNSLSQLASAEAKPGPVVFTRQLQTVKPGEAIQLNGAGFTASTAAKLWRVVSPGAQDLPQAAWVGAAPPSLPDAPPSEAITLGRINYAHDVLHLALPAAKTKIGIYAVYTTGDGTNWSAKPFVFNHPQVYFLNYRNARPGAEVKAVGINLKSGDKPGYVYLYKKGSSPIPCKVVRATDNELGFMIPLAAAKGDYEVWVHNGSGGQYGFDHSTTITVAVDRLTLRTVYDVTQSPFNADKTGKSDAASAIQSAIQAAAANGKGGIVYFPAGSYMISGPLTYDSSLGDVTFRGEGGDKSVLSFDTAAGFKKEAMFSLRTPKQHANENKTVIEDLGFDTSYKRGTAIDLFGRNNVTVNRVRVKADNWQGSDDLYSGVLGIALGYSKENTISNSDIYANDGISVASAIDLRIFGNRIYSVYPRQNREPDNDAIRLYGSKRAAVYDNVIDRDALQNQNGKSYYYGRGVHIGGNRIYSALFGEENAAYNEDLYIGFNTIRRAGMPGANDGEIIVADGAHIPGGGKVFAVSSANADSLTTNAATGWAGATEGEKELRGTYVYIVGGKGVGQVRKIADYTTTTLTVAGDWDIAPDTTSRFIVTPTHARQIFADNTATDNQKYIGIYGEGFLNTIARNTIDAGTYDGTLGAGITFYPYVAMDMHNKYPVFYNEARDNRINKGMIYMPNEDYSGRNVTLDYPIARGNVIAGNTITNFPQAVSIGGADRPKAVWNIYNLVMNNVIGAGVKKGVVVSQLSDRTLLINPGSVTNKGTNTTSVSIGTAAKP